jgi:flagellar protein FlaG
MDISKVNQAALPTNVGGVQPVASGAEVSAAGLKPEEQVSETSQSKQAETLTLQNAVSKLNEYVQVVQRSIQFEIDDLTGQEIVKVLDSETDEVIRQMPRQEVLNFARQLAEQNQSDDLILFSDKA